MVIKSNYNFNYSNTGVFCTYSLQSLLKFSSLGSSSGFKTSFVADNLGVFVANPTAELFLHFGDVGESIGLP